MDDIMNLAQLSGALATGNLGQRGLDSSLKKALTTTAGFLGVNLESQAKILLPLFAGLRHRYPVDTPSMGAATAQWRMQLGFGAFNFGAAANFGTANGANGGATAPSATTIAADYKSLSINGEVQWEAIQQARGFDNAMTIDTMWALSALLRLEELICLYANEAAISAPVITGTSATLSSALTFAVGTWSVIVTAITGQGALTNASSNSPVGESVNSNTAAVVVAATAKDFLDVSWPAVPGAVGYKVYCNSAVNGGAGATTLCDPATKLAYAKTVSGSFLTTKGDAIVVPTGQTFVTVNHVQIIAVPTAGTPPPGAEGTANANVFEGTLAWCEKSTIYGQALPFRNIIDQAGLLLTTSGTGIAEFDSILQTQWQINHTSPSLILCSSNSIVSMGNKIAAAGSNSQIRLDVYQDRNRVVGGLYVGGYVNKFASSMAGMQTTIDVWAHPYMPDGSFLFLSENIPNQTYPYSRTAKAFALDVQTPYTYFELGRTQRSFPYDVFLGETLKCYWPSAQAAIVGARVDS
jgi:hypothetical protein